MKTTKTRTWLSMPKLSKKFSKLGMKKRFFEEQQEQEVNNEDEMNETNPRIIKVTKANNLLLGRPKSSFQQTSGGTSPNPSSAPSRALTADSRSEGGNTFVSLYYPHR
ncbi:hypothetical protein RMATCC62417_11727 [Rhizopus microsporus]|nr:hypothetical protein RMATCC62417_11727 [Rhizopus microsporus]